MRTIETTVYTYDELSDEAKQKAINDYRNEGVFTDHVYDDAYETVKNFHQLFGTKEGSRSWLDVDTGSIDDNICELQGMRLRTYIVNNYPELYKGKYYSLWSKTEQNSHYREGGHAPKGKLKTRRSKIMMDNCCVLTGVCYDQSILSPIYGLIEWNEKADYNSYQDFENLMNDCFGELEKDIESEVEYLNSDEAIAETIKANEYEFTEDGTQF